LDFLGLAKGQTLDCEGVTSPGDSSSGMYFLSFMNKHVPVTTCLQVQLKMSLLKGEFRAFGLTEEVKGCTCVLNLFKLEPKMT
jgi:hypothetical protein